MKTDKQYRHVIWDWNGTLIDDAELVVQSINQALIALGHSPVSLDFHRDNFEVPVYRYYLTLGLDPDKHDFDQLAAIYISSYNACIQKKTLHREAYTTLQALHAANITQSVLSAFEHNALLALLEQHNLRRFFCKVTGHINSLGECKIQLGKDKLATMKIPPEDILLVGDTRHDYTVAQALGIDCALLSHGHNSHRRLQSCGVPVFPSMVSLRTWLQLNT